MVGVSFGLLDGDSGCCCVVLGEDTVGGDMVGAIKDA